MSQKNYNEYLLPIEEIINRAKARGVSFGHGNPVNRLRYYTKIGLIPYATRKLLDPTFFKVLKASGTVAHYPEAVIDQLVELDRQLKAGRSIADLTTDPPRPPQTFSPNQRDPSESSAYEIVSDGRTNQIFAAPSSPKLWPSHLPSQEVGTEEFGSSSVRARDNILVKKLSSRLAQFSFLVSGIIFITFITVISFPQTKDLASQTLALLKQTPLRTLLPEPTEDNSQLSTLNSQLSTPSVLATSASLDTLKIQAITTIIGPTTLTDQLNANGGIITNGANINLGSGELTAGNVIYGLIAGDNVSVTEGQTPTIAVDLPADLVNTIQGQSGALILVGGTDISISGLTISNNSTLSSVTGRGASTSSLLTLSGGLALTCTSCITDTNVANNLTIDSTGNVSGTAITSGLVGVGVGGTGLTSYTSGDVLYASGGTTLTKLGIGTSGQALVVSGGVPTWTTISGGGITADSLDFTEFQDSLDLDANTVISNSSFTLSFRGAQNYVFDSASISTLTISNQLIGTGVINSGNIVDGTIVASDLSVDSLDFDRFEDSLDLDVSTVITTGGNSLVIRGSGGLVTDSANITQLTLGCTGCITSTNLLDGTIVAADISADTLNFTSLTDSLALDAHTVLSSSDFTLSFRGANAVVFDSANISTLTLTNVLNGTGVINSTNILDGTIVSGDVSADTLNFTSLSDSLTLDANTVISNSDFTLSFRGAQNYVFDSASISTLTLTNSIIGTGVVTSTNILDGTIVNGDVSADTLDFTAFSDSLTLDASTVISAGANTLSFRGAQNYQFDSALITTLTVTNNLIGTGIVDSTNIDDGGILAVDISADALDFTQFADSLTLDANTVISNSSFTLSFRGPQAYVFDSANITQLTLGCTGCITSTNLLDGTILAADLSVDSLDFDRFEDSLELDANTVVTTSGNTLTFRGAEAIVFDSANISTLTLTNVLNGTGVINSTNILNNTIVAGDISADTLNFTELTDSLALDAHTVIDSSSFNLTFRGNTVTFDSANITTLAPTNVVCTGCITSTNILDGTIVAGDLSVDTLDFDRFEDSLDLDVSTVISNAGLTLAFRGSANYVFDSASISTLTLSNQLIGTGVINSGNILDGTIVAADLSVDSLDFDRFEDSLDLDANTVVSVGASTLTFRGAQGVVFDSATISQLTLNCTGCIDSTDILDGTITDADLSADTLDFTEFEDSLELDAHTVISSSDFTLSFRGANSVVFDSSNISTLTLTNVLNGTGVINSTNILNNTLVAADISADTLNFTELTDSLALDANTVISNSDFTLSFRGAQNYVFDSASIATLTLTNNLIGTGIVDSTNIDDGGILAADISVDSLDFAQFQDSLDLDSATVLTQGTNTFFNTFSGTTGPAWTFNSTGAVTSGVAGVDINVSSASTTTDSVHISNSGTGDALQIDQRSTSAGYALNVNGRNSIFNSAQDGNVGSWSSNSYTLPENLLTQTTVSANGYVYVLGGCVSYSGICLTSTSRAYYAKINSNGSLGSWSTNVYSLPELRSHATSVVSNGYVYVIGGWDDAKVVSTVYYAKLNSDGSTRTWATSAYTLPQALYDHTSVVANGYMYVFGGNNISIVATSTVYYSKLNPDGTIGSWSTNSRTLPQRLFDHSTAVANGYVYVIGGNGTSGLDQSTVYYAPLNSDGSTGAWTSNSYTLPQFLRRATSLVVNGYLYVLGGGESGANTVYYAKLNSDGSTGNWSSSVYTLPQTLLEHSSVQANGYLYVLGGYGSDPTSTVYYSSTARVSVAGNLDLLGQTAQSLTDANGNGGSGSTGGSIYAGNIFSNGTLEVIGNSNFWNGLSVNGGLTLGGSSASDYGQLTLLGKGSTGNPAACGVGSVYFNTTDSTFQGCTGSNSWTRLDNTAITASQVSADTLDFAQFEDSLDLDVSTVISNAGLTLAFRGSANYVFDSASIATLTLTNSIIGTGVVTSTNILDGTLVNGDVSADTLDFTAFSDSLTLDASTVISAGANTLSFRGAQNYVFDSASISTLTLTNAIIGTGVVTSTNILDGTIVAADLSVDSLDFDRFEDSLDLDANTVVSVGASTLTFRGAQGVVFDSATISQLTLNCTGCIDSTDILDGTIVGGDVSADTLDFTAFSDSLTLDASTVITAGANTLSFRGAQNYQFDSALITTLTVTNNLIGTGIVDSTNIDDDSILSADVSADTLDFTDFEDSLDLDSATVLTQGTNTFFSTFSGTTGPAWTFNSTGAVTSGVAGIDINVSAVGTTTDAVHISNSGTGDALQIDQRSTSTGYALNVNGRLSIFNSAQDGSTGGWSTNAYTLPGTARINHSSVVANGYVYVLGGSTGSAYQSTVYYAKLNSDGSTEAWSTNAYTLPGTARGFHSSVVANGYVYVLGGLDGSTYQSTVYYAKLNSDGSTGAWSTNAYTLPDTARINHSSVVANGYVYVLGGYTGSTYQSTVYYAKLNSDGSTGSWATNAYTLPDTARGRHSSVVANGYVYVLGGESSATAYQSTVYYAPLAKIQVSGSLDLLGQTTGNLADYTSTGGEIYAGNIFSVGGLDIKGNSNFWNGLSVNGGLTLGGSSASDYGQLTLLGKGSTGNPAACGVGSVYFNTTDSTFQGCTGSNSWTRLDNTAITASQVSADTLDFAQFEDSLDLDVSTVISNAGLTLAFRGSANYVFDSASIATLTLTNAIIGTGVVTSTNILDGTIVAADLSVDSLDFAQFEDSLDLDVSTVISNGGNTLAFRGSANYVFDSASISTLTLTNAIIGTGVINSGNILDGTIVAGDISADTFNFTELTDSLALDAHTVISSSDFTLSFRGANSVVFDSANISTLTLTNVLNGTGVINSTNILDGTILNGDVSADTLDFAQFEDSLDLDVSTVISNAGLTLAFRGSANYVFDSASISTLTITNPIVGTGIVTSTNILDDSIVSGDVSADTLDFTDFEDSLDLDSATVLTQGTNTFFNTFSGTTGPAWTFNSTGAVTSGVAGVDINVSSASTTTDSVHISNSGTGDALQIDQRSSSTGFALNVNGKNSIFNSAQDGSTGAWSTNAYTIPNTARGLHSSVVANGYIYIIGGYNNSTYQSTVYYAKLNSDGSTGAWSTNVYTIPGVARANHSSVVANGYVYVLGGRDTSATQSTVYYAKLNSDGSTGTWSTNAYTIPGVARQQHSSVVANGYVYILGGSTGSVYQSTVYYAKLNSDGSTGAWSTNSYTLPEARGTHSSVVANGYVYVLGGHDGSAYQSTVYYAKLNADGSTGAWSTNVYTIPGTARGVHSSVVANGYVYVLGGNNGGIAYQSTVYYAKLSSDGSTGTWSTNAYTIPGTARGQHSSVVANGYVYILGGTSDGSTYQSTVYYAPLAKISIAGDLDLLSQTSANLSDANGNSGQGSTGGSIYAGNIFSNGTLEVIGNSQFWNGLSVNGGLTLGGSSASDYGQLTLLGKGSTGNPAACGVGSVYFNTTDSTFQGCTGSNTWTRLDNTSITGSQISADSLDFAQFEDSLDLDVSTVITAGANTLSFRGAQNYQFDSALITTLTVTNNLIGTGIVDSTNIDDDSIVSVDVSADTLDFTDFEDSLDLDSATVLTQGSNTFFNTFSGTTGPAWTFNSTGAVTSGVAGIDINVSAVGTTTDSVHISNSGTGDALQIDQRSTSAGYALNVNGRNSIFNSAQDGSTGSWSTNVYTIPNGARGEHSSVMANGYVYVLGGSNATSSGTYQNTVYYAKLNSDGSTGSWSTSVYTIPDIRTRHSSVVANGYVYVIGGLNDFGGSTNTVYYAKLNSDGSTGAWSSNVYTIPGLRRNHSSVVANGYVYVLGGSDGSYQSTVYYAKLNSDGSTGAWSTNIYTIPGVARGYHSSVVANGYVYVLGGEDVSFVDQSTVYYAKLNSDGSTGAWSTNAYSLPGLIIGHSSVVANGYVYVLGGSDQSNVYYAKLNSDGSTGAWSTNIYTIPTVRGYHTSIAANGYVYVLGGSNNGVDYKSTVYYAPLARVSIAGNLDLLGQTSGAISDANGNSGQGSTGGSIYAGNIFSNGTLEVIGNSNFWNGLSVNGGLTLGGSSASDYGQLTLLGKGTTGNPASCGVGSVYFNTTDSTFQGCTGANSWTRLDNTAITASQVSADTLDFAQFEDSLDLDVSTVISNAGLTLAFRGSQNYVFDSIDVNMLNVTNCTGCAGVGADSLDFTHFEDTLDLDSANLTLNQGTNIWLQTFTGTTGPGLTYLASGAVTSGDAAAIDINVSSNSTTVDAVTISNSGTGDALQIDQRSTSTGYALNVNGKNSIFNSAQDGSTGSWSTNAYTIPVLGSEHSSVVANGYVYILGGTDDTTRKSTVYYAKLNSDGSTGAWSTNVYTLPALRSNHSSVAANGYIYVLGGGTAGGNYQSTVFYAKLNSDGSTGSWSSNVYTLPGLRNSHSSVVANGYVYVFGGADGGAAYQSTVYYAKLNSDGSTGSWSTNVYTLPALQIESTSVVANGYVYILGGITGSPFPRTSTVYYARLNSDGSTGAWSTNVYTLPGLRGYPSSVVANGYVYVIGGSSAGTTYTSTVFYAKLNSNGSTGAWSTNVYTLPTLRAEHSSVVANGYVYVLGGNNGINYESTVYYTSLARISVAGTLDLLGQTSGSLTDASGEVGGQIYAGKIYSNNDIEASGNGIFYGGLTANNGLVVENNSAFNLDGGETLAATTNGSAGAWSTNAYTIPGVGIGLHSSVVANGYVYVIGGTTTALTYTSTVYYAKLNSDGSTGAWSTNVYTIPGVARSQHSSVMANGYVYVLGGTTDGSAYTSTVYYAKLQSNGSTGAWSTNVYTIPGTARGRHSSVVANGYVYILGGRNDSAYQSTVYYAKLNSDGSTGAWSTNAYTIPGVARGQHSSVVANGYVYVLGGINQSSVYQSTVYYAKLNSDGSTGAWSTNAYTIPGVARGQHSSVVANGYVYVLGGDTGSAYISTVYYAKLNADGSTGAWSTNVYTLPDGVGRSTHSSVVANGYVYVIGGYNGAAYQSKVYYTSLGRTSIASGLEVTGDAQFWDGLTIRGTGSTTSGSDSATEGEVRLSATGGLQFSGTARPYKTLALNAEYAGGTLSAFYGAGTDTNISGSMTSDTDTSGNLLRNYYLWNRTTATQHFYTVAVRVELPSDFDYWAPANAIEIDYLTESTTSTNSLLDVYIYNGDDTPATAVTSDTGNVSATANVWTSVSLDDSVLISGSAPEWDGAGETAVIYLRMGSQSGNEVRVGDIRLNYLARF